MAKMTAVHNAQTNSAEETAVKHVTKAQTEDLITFSGIVLIKTIHLNDNGSARLFLSMGKDEPNRMVLMRKSTYTELYHMMHDTNGHPYGMNMPVTFKGRSIPSRNPGKPDILEACEVVQKQHYQSPQYSMPLPKSMHHASDQYDYETPQKITVIVAMNSHREQEGRHGSLLHRFFVTTCDEGHKRLARLENPVYQSFMACIENDIIDPKKPITLEGMNIRNDIRNRDRLPLFQIQSFKQAEE